MSVLYADGDGGFGETLSLDLVENDPAGLALLGPVSTPRAFALANSYLLDFSVYGDASRP